MGTALHSFMDIFDTVFDVGGEQVPLKKIEIPIIQRDYAQGRRTSDVARVRDRFLDSLYHAVTQEPITLDFIYGDIDERGVMAPLDGQQRLTTLFLLHWYAAKKEQVPEGDYGFLKNFSYETRYSTRYFCTELVEYTPLLEGAVSEEIMNQAWFPLDWKKDPTISSMLTMLDAIAQKFGDATDIWGRLKDGAVTFYFLPIKDMGLTDELYIKMNSRGKPLTSFEHFKAELEHRLRSVDVPAAERVMLKIDRTWTDLLWQYRNGSNGSNEGSDGDRIDDAFLCYFRFICDMICYKQGGSPQGENSDAFGLLQTYFSFPSASPDKHALGNIVAVEAYFDCWCGIDGFRGPSEFLESFLSHRHEEGKILVDSRYKINIFEDCLHAYTDKTGHARQFPLNRIVLLYAITCYLLHQGEVSRADFIRRIRIVNNLIQNSEDEVSDRIDRNRIPAILSQVDAIILTGRIDDSIESNFNVSQLQEEKEKAEYLQSHPEDAEALFELEDNPMLKGQIGIVGLENLAYGKRFASLFTCAWDRIDCALMSIGDYGQQERNKWHYQYASKGRQLAWDELFHKSANTGFHKTKDILIQLIATHKAFTDDILKGISDAFINGCEEKRLYPWRYYYVKYPVFRPGSFGKLSNKDAKGKPYLFSVMQTKSLWSQNTYMPYLKAADDKHLSRDDMGQRLVYGERHIICENTSYILRENDGEQVVEEIAIAQNGDGIDTEDRIVKLKAYIQEKKLAGL